MKKIKDIFYDLNDILVALVIIAAAAFVISINMNSILNYPSAIAEGMEVPKKDTPTIYAENPPISQSNGDDAVPDGEATGAGTGGEGENVTGGGVTGNPGAGTTGDPGAGTGEVVNYSVYIEPGSTGEKIADLLVGVGLFKDRSEFLSAAAAAGVEGKLRAGNFIIPSDSTPAEVLAILVH